MIKTLFLSYFDSYVIDGERKTHVINLNTSGFFSFKGKIRIDSEDFITVSYKGNHFHLQEIILMHRKELFFKGLLCSTNLKYNFDQTFIINSNNNKVNKLFADGNFKHLFINKVIIYYQESFNQELARPFIDFTEDNNVALSIQNDKIHCLIPTDHINMNEPTLLHKFNSNNTYTYIRNEYYRVSKISRLLLKLEEIAFDNTLI